MNDRILDLCLEEALGGAHPPDLAERVVAALREKRREGQREGQRDAETENRSEALRGALAPRPIAVPSLVSAPLLGPSDALGHSVSPCPPPSVSSGGPALASRGIPANLPHPTLKHWLPLALAASLLAAIGGYWVMGRSHDAQHPAVDRTSASVAAVDVRPTDNSEKATSLVRDGRGSMSLTSQSPDGTSLVRENVPAIDHHASAVVSGADDVRTSPVTETAAPHNPEIDASTAGEAWAASSLAGVLSASATSDEEVVAFINSSLKARWKEAGVRPSPVATEAEWCRRAYLDCIGRIPTVEELEAFLIDNSPKSGAHNKRAKLIERLLEDDRYIESYARFWTTLWTNLLIGRTGGMQPNSPVNREGLEQYLRRSFLSNKPYNQVVYELISAQGSNQPGDDDYNGAVNFLLAHLREKATPATAKTAQIFLGLQVQCTQCHNHPFNDWKQNRFWELNAFFRQAREERRMEGNQLNSVRLIDEDFAGEGSERVDPREAEVYFEQRNGILQVAYPTFIDGTAVDANGLVSAVNRRRELARLVIRSDEMKRAIANRLWAQFLGYGFTKPVDDQGTHNPPSHPELLARLADEFAGHGYDLKRLIRWITLSDAYALSSKFGPKLGNAADDPKMGTPPLFSHFYVRQMSAEQLYDSLLAATAAHRTQASYAEQQRLKDRWLEQFAIAFATDENDEATTFDGTIAQTLVMMNGELTRQATSGETGSFLSQVSTTADRGSPLNELYLAALARRPSRGEVQAANGLLTAPSGNAATALEDIWWALLNSNEFILNH